VQFTGVELVQLGDFLGQVGRALHQAQGVLQHHLALRRGAQILAATVDQLAAEFLLQALDAAAEGRLGDAHGIGRANETAVFGEGDEVTQLAQIHDALPALKILDEGICRRRCAGFKCKLLFRQRRIKLKSIRLRNKNMHTTRSCPMATQRFAVSPCRRECALRGCRR
jgi:hypothetical protein